MIYLFHGSDIEKSRAKWHGVIQAFQTKYPAGQVFNFDSEHFDATKFAELAQGADLFGEKRLVASNRVLENELASVFLRFQALIRN